MGFRDLRSALEHRRAALESERAELDHLLSNLSAARARRQWVDQELRDVEAAMMWKPRLVERVDVASPCNASWDEMTGDDRRRFCSRCDKHVYNLSAMTADEAEAMIYEAEGKLCVRFFRRADGTMMTSDCSVGQKRRRLRVLAAVGIAAAGAGVAGLAGGAAIAHVTGEELRADVVRPPTKALPTPGRATMGVMAITPMAPRRAR